MKTRKNSLEIGAVLYRIDERNIRYEVQLMRMERVFVDQVVLQEQLYMVILQKMMMDSYI